MIVYSAADLLWATRIKRTGDQIGVLCRPAREPGTLRDRLGEGGVRGVIVDLECEHALELIEIAAAEERGVRVVAFGPHVEIGRLEAARQAGAEVMTRGAFDRRLTEVLGGLWSDD